MGQPNCRGLADAARERIAHGARGLERATVAGEAVVRDQTLQPDVSQVDVLGRFRCEVPDLVRMVQADTVRMQRVVMDDVDVAIVEDRGHEAVPHRARAGGDPPETQHLRQIVLEVAPGIAALDPVAVAREVPVAPGNRQIASRRCA
jgi:hypothetical protein